MDSSAVGLLCVAVILLLLALRVPVGIALALPALVGIGVIVGDLGDGGLQATSTLFHVFSQPSFVVIPLFVAMGTLAFTLGLADDIFGMIARWVSPFRGGLAIATAIACGLFAGVSGSSVATVATMARTAIPEMLKYKYSPMLAGATVAAAGSVGILIPPSTILVLYGILADQSIGMMLLAGVVPGVLSVAIDVTTIRLLVQWKPHWAPPTGKVPLRERIEWTLKGWTILVIFVVVVGGIYTGIWQPSESAAAGVACIVVLSVMQRRFRARAIVNGMRDAVSITASLMLVIAGAFLLARLLALSGLTGATVSYFASLEVSPILLIVMIILLLSVLGMFLEGTTILALTVPILVPAIVEVGYDPIWFGVIMVKAVELALYTPPVGLNVYTLVAAYPSIGVGTVFRGVIPFMIAEWFTLGVLIAFPFLITALPDAAIR